MNKVCNKCLKVKPLYDFYKNKKGHRGVSSRCKDCDKLARALKASDTCIENENTIKQMYHLAEHSGQVVVHVDPLNTSVFDPTNLRIIDDNYIDDE